MGELCGVPRAALFYKYLVRIDTKHIFLEDESDARHPNDRASTSPAPLTPANMRQSLAGPEAISRGNDASRDSLLAWSWLLAQPKIPGQAREWQKKPE
jgi:hypothetical protein